MSNDLLIKINADAENATKAFEDIRKKTEDLEESLKKTAEISGVAFAALTAELYFSVHAFEDAQKAAIQLTTALQDQGIYTEELAKSYEEYAAAVEAKTGIEENQVKKSLAIAQGYLGQTKITEELAFAIADLGAKMGGDLNGAAEKVARTIGTGTNAFMRQGLVLDAASTTAERYTKVLEFVQLKAGGLAEEFNKADGYTKALASSFEKAQIALGAKFGPAIASVRQSLSGVLDYFSQSPRLVEFASAMLAIGIAITGIIAAVAVAIPTFLALSAVFTTVAAVVSGPILLGIGLVVLAVVGLTAGITALGFTFNNVLAFMQSIAKAALATIGELFAGLATTLKGVFALDPSQIIKGLEQVKAAVISAKNITVQSYEEISAVQTKARVEQDAARKIAADKVEAEERAHQARLIQIQKESIDLIRLQNQNASADLIALKSKEVETLKAVDSQKKGAERDALIERLAILHNLENEQRAQDGQKEIQFLRTQQQIKQDLIAEGFQAEGDLTAQKKAELRAQEFTQLDATRQILAEETTARQNAQKQQLLDTTKNEGILGQLSALSHSKRVQDAANAANQLVALEQSKNETLKTIGKVAGVAQVVIKTPEAAMNAYNSLVGIPYIGPVLAFAAAAATYAFGAEQIGNILAAADGGLVTGGIAGTDSVPALLTPGELVVPTKNFDQVVGAVRNDGQGGGNNDQIVNILERIHSKITTPQTTIIQGDVHTDDSYVDALVRKISDAIEFRNAKIVGVNI